MRLWRLTLVIMCLAAPAAGQDSAPCWRADASAGIFGWAGAPSITCRNRVSQQVPGPVAPPRTPKPEVAAKAGQTRSDSAITFSGEAYVGAAWAF